MSLRFGEHEDVVFEKAPLLVVLCQIKFPAVLSLMSKTGVAGFQEALREEYPQFEPEQSAQIGIGRQKVSVSEAAPVWRLSDESARLFSSLAGC